ncbi:hypothetical protein Nepgr_002826 [Nepenthes gracilis]|uniref:Uncharacterized protein n=1 Tax=Nepenthes gracilis TaxID=150966 RepID=A0AAD3P7T3_NEPGR|nr:hypothetical protein Nepgr_002826 [Nepenthes gracilis]
MWIAAKAGNSAAHGITNALLVAGHVKLQRQMYFGQRSLLAKVRLCKCLRWTNKACYAEMLYVTKSMLKVVRGAEELGRLSNLWSHQRSLCWGYTKLGG